MKKEKLVRTVRTKVYKFKALSEDAKQKAIEHYRKYVDVNFIYDDAHETVKAFHDIFGTKPGRNSWLDVSTDHIEDNVLNLKGLRLHKYIWNNYAKYLYKGKYFSLWSKRDITYQYHKEGYPVLKSRHSKIISDNCCVLTGVCYDDSLLQPLYEFLDWKLRPDYNSYMDFETLMNDCFANLGKDVHAEEEAQYSDTVITDNIEANEYEFTIDGKPFHG